MRKLICCLLLFLALYNPSVLAAETGTTPSLWPACDPVTGLWGYIDAQGAWKIAPQFGQAYHFHGGCAIVDTGNAPSWQQTETEGIIDETGMYLLEPEYSVDDAVCWDGAGALYLVSRHGPEGFRMGWFNIPNRFFSGMSWDECYAWSDTPYILINEDYRLSGLADRATGEIVVPMEYSYTGLYDWGIGDGFVVAERSDTGECELIEIGVGPVALPEDVTIECYPGVTEGLIAFQQEGMGPSGGLYGYLDMLGEIAIPAQFTDAGGFVDGYASVMLPGEDLLRIIDHRGQTALKLDSPDDLFMYEAGYIGRIADAFFIIWPYDCWSLINDDGTVRCSYDFPEDVCDVRLFENGPDAPLTVLYYLPDEEYAYGLMSRDGEMLVEPCWDALGSTDEWGWRAACIDGEWYGSKFTGTWGYVDVMGNTMLPFIYTDAESFRGELALVRFDERTEGYIDHSGRVVYSWPSVDDDW